MIPPFLATLGGKIATGVISALLLSLAWMAYKDSIRDEGRDEIRAEQKAEEQKQQAAVDVVEKKQYDSLLAVVDRTAEESKRFHTNLIQSTKRLSEKEQEVARLQSYIDATKTQHPDVQVKYVEVDKQAPCLVPDHVTARVDELAGVLNAIPYRRVSNDDGPDAEPPVQSTSPATCAQLVGRLEVLTARLGDAEIAWRGLTEYVVQEREINRAFHVHQKERGQ